MTTTHDTLKKPASKLDWPKQVTRFLSTSEFPAGALDQMDARIILALSDLRKKVGEPLYPSPVLGAHVRHSGSSRHSINGGTRLSDATDFFCSWSAAWRYLDAARRHPEIGGIGIYTDMVFNPRGATPGLGDWAMIHIDGRAGVAEWIGWRKGQSAPIRYASLQRDPLEYHRLLAERGVMR